eukprot:symbB.v1.2.013628.t1/scaffold970.1/size148061/1
MMAVIFDFGDPRAAVVRQHVLQPEMREALRIASEQDYEYMRYFILDPLSKVSAPSSMTMAAMLATSLTKEDPVITEALIRCASDERLNAVPLGHLLPLAEAFAELTESAATATNPFVAPIVARLVEEARIAAMQGEDYSYHDVLRAVKLLQRIGPKRVGHVELVIEKMNGYLLLFDQMMKAATRYRDNPDLEQEIFALLNAALTCLDELSPSTMSSTSRAYDRLVSSLIGYRSRCWLLFPESFSTNQKQVLQLLRHVAEKMDGLKSGHLWRIAMGFDGLAPRARRESKKLFQDLPKSPTADPVKVLFQILDEKLNVVGCCVAIDILVTMPPSPDITARLLKVLQEPEGVLKAAALDALRTIVAGDARAARDLPCDLVVPCTEDVEDVVRAAALKLVVLLVLPVATLLKMFDRYVCCGVRFYGRLWRIPVPTWFSWEYI